MISIDNTYCKFCNVGVIEIWGVKSYNYLFSLVTNLNLPNRYEDRVQVVVVVCHL
jgi:hypothetical protein